MKVVEYVAPLGIDGRRRVRHTRFEGKVTEFMVQYEIFVKGKMIYLSFVMSLRETSFALHWYLRHGHLEKVYENGLAHRLRKVQLAVEQQYPLKVYDEDGYAL